MQKSVVGRFGYQRLARAGAGGEGKSGERKKERRRERSGEQGETKRGLGAPSPGHRASAFRNT